MVRFALLSAALAVGDAARIAKKRNASISIVNGEPADECEWKWQVGLGSGTTPWCGGMIISENWVLTAAHCLSGETSVSVIAGQWNVRQTSGNEQRRTASNVIMHPQYNSGTLEYDFGLLELDTPFTFNSCVGAIPLPTADVSDGDSCWITGWGTLRSGGSQPDVLQEAQVNVISNQRCMDDFDYGQGMITDSMLCAQGRNANGGITDACQGDSGGPLVCQQGGQFVIQGATSWGYGCAGATAPGVWARVWNQLDWIQSTAYTGPPTPAPPTPPPPPPGTWELSGSGCTMSGACVSSSNYPSNYGNNQACTVQLWGDIPLSTEAFDTESGYDYLTVGGTQYSGSSGPSSGSYTGAMTWSSDYSVVRSGWRICRTD